MFLRVVLVANFFETIADKSIFTYNKSLSELEAKPNFFKIGNYNNNCWSRCKIET